MAKKPETDSFIDMFASFGRDLRMPNMDVDKILDQHRKNLEALEKAAKSASTGATDVFSKQREILQSTLSEITEMAEQMRSPGSPQDMMGRQAEFARKSFETAVKNASEIGEVMRKSSTETIDILRERIREAMEDMQKGYRK